jgi:hypothetical protein
MFSKTVLILYGHKNVKISMPFLNVSGGGGGGGTGKFKL